MLQARETRLRLKITSKDVNKINQSQKTCFATYESSREIFENLILGFQTTCKDLTKLVANFFGNLSLGISGNLLITCKASHEFCETQLLILDDLLGYESHLTTLEYLFQTYTHQVCNTNNIYNQSKSKSTQLYGRMNQNNQPTWPTSCSSSQQDKFVLLFPIQQHS